MKLFSIFISLFLGLSTHILNPPKIVSAYRTPNPIVLDGELNEPSWDKASSANDFTQLKPTPGEKASQTTEVKIIYDDHAIYIGAKLSDSDPDKILMQMSERDDLGNTDFFGVVFDTYQGGVNGVGFLVTPSEVQFDMKLDTRNEDEGWDAVWFAKTKITEDGWIAEMRIPYSALRFPKKDVQEWGVNFTRMIKRNNEQVFWNEVDPNIQGFINQSGKLTGLKNIKAPLRLSANPFVAVYAENYSSKKDNISEWGRSFSGGMDVKLGLNDAFTLDMTLIPDFGQVRSDNEVLNLTPFEVQFNENRQFFTEGTELFDKADVFYSRRIGGRPFYYSDVKNKLKEGEVITENPRDAQLYNATKVSGRTNGGTGIGVFNAITGRTYAKIENSEGETREVLTNPFSNYSVVVVDQNLKNNSYISLINTNVMRAGTAYDANVTGLEGNIKNRENTYSVNLEGAISQKFFGDKTNVGHAYDVEFAKISGKFLGEIGYNEISDTYDPNDLGFLTRNNVKHYHVYVKYEENSPFGAFNNANIGVFTRYTRQYNPDEFSDLGISIWGGMETKTFHDFSSRIRIEPVATFDFFEPRETGRFYRYPTNFSVNLEWDSDRRKKMSVGIEGDFRNFDEEGRQNIGFEVKPRFRFTNNFSMHYSWEFSKYANDVGYVTHNDADSEIVFGIRDVKTVENRIGAQYSFDQNTNLNFNLRHYWSRVIQNSFHSLLEDGRLGLSNYSGEHNRNFNAFTIDMVFKWRFAPGSDVIAVWKNSVVGDTDEIFNNYYKNSKYLFDQPKSNSFSLKLVYYLDYLDFAKKPS
jgi:hypothetical protein